MTVSVWIVCPPCGKRTKAKRGPVDLRGRLRWCNTCEECGRHYEIPQRGKQDPETELLERHGQQRLFR